MNKKKFLANVAIVLSDSTVFSLMTSKLASANNDIKQLMS